MTIGDYINKRIKELGKNNNLDEKKIDEFIKIVSDKVNKDSRVGKVDSSFDSNQDSAGRNKAIIDSIINETLPKTDGSTSFGGR